MNRGSRTKLAVIGALGALAILALPAAQASAAKAPKGFFGVAPQTGLEPRDVTLMKKADVGTVRLIFNWPDIDRGGWGPLDAQIGRAAAQGIKTIPTLYGAAPGSSNPRTPPLKKKDLAAWRAFVQEAVQRYGPGGAYWANIYPSQSGGAKPQPIKQWQVWNEPNSHQFFPPKGNPKKYGKLLKASSKAIRAEHRKANVMLGGMFGETGPKNMPIHKFVAKLYKVKGVKKSFKTAAIHPYAKPKALKKQFAPLRKVMNKAKHKKAKIWVSEIGYSSGGPKKKPVVTKSKKAQAKALKQSFKIILKNRKRYKISGVTWFSWEDSKILGICTFCRKAGLVTPSLKPKPAFRAFKKIAR